MGDVALDEGIMGAAQNQCIQFLRIGIEKLVQHVETSVCRKMEQEVTSEEIGLLIMEGLKSLDEVAYIRFASVYRQFKDVQSFMEELQQLLDARAPGIIGAITGRAIYEGTLDLPEAMAWIKAQRA